jgi:hypothetical protein
MRRNDYYIQVYCSYQKHGIEEFKKSRNPGHNACMAAAIYQQN